MSTNVEDRRGMPVRGVVGGGIGALVLGLIAMFLGVDPRVIMDSGGGGAPSQQERGGAPPENDQAASFVRVVLADTEDVWNTLFQQQGAQYQEPRLALFSGAVESACGVAQSAVGPFYCPRDAEVYIDLDFYRELRDRFGAPGDFAQAYVIAHEVGHHVQNLMGTSSQVHDMQQQADQTEANQLSVRLELQADCYAGVWANHAERMKQILEPGDVEEALNAAASIGDDKIQAQSRGYVTPDSFTHGSGEQRVRWFRKGLSSGRVDQCDTFQTRSL